MVRKAQLDIQLPTRMGSWQSERYPNEAEKQSAEEFLGWCREEFQDKLGDKTA